MLYLIYLCLINNLLNSDLQSHINKYDYNTIKFIHEFDSLNRSFKKISLPYKYIIENSSIPKYTNFIINNYKYMNYSELKTSIYCLYDVIDFENLTNEDKVSINQCIDYLNSKMYNEFIISKLKDIFFPIFLWYRSFDNFELNINEKLDYNCGVLIFTISSYIIVNIDRIEIIKFCITNIQNKKPCREKPFRNNK